MIHQSFENHILLPYPTIIEKLVKWYDKNHEVFPWRESNDPYKVWLSEVMLQQTTVATVIPYYKKFLDVFPTLESLADADIDQVLTLWQGLGYYRRAHMLHKGAIYIMHNHQGSFPNNYKDLLKVPGIGKYTAKALLSIALNEPFVPVDGNVIRVFSRLFGKTDDFEKLEKSLEIEIYQFEQALINKNSGYFAQSLMDLGREVCKPKNPLCHDCPISDYCKAYKQQMTDKIPAVKKKEKVPTRYAHCFIYKEKSGIYLIKNNKKGLFEGMWTLPITEMSDIQLKPANLKHLGSVPHTFTHFKLILEVYEGGCVPSDAEVVNLNEIHNYALPTLMKKALRLYSNQRLDTAA